jgi:hypothetical protein
MQAICLKIASIPTHYDNGEGNAWFLTHQKKPSIYELCSPEGSRIRETCFDNPSIIVV